MSFSGSEQKQQSQANSFYDPTQTGLVDQYASDLNQTVQPGSLSYQPYTGPGLNFGDPSTLKNLTGFTAPSVTAGTYSPSTIDPASISDVSSGQLATTNLQPYENPFQSDVINSTINQAMRAKGIADTNDAGTATAAGAFGGSRSAVLQNLDDNTWQQNLQSTLAGLNSQNFSQAQGAAEQDIGTKLQADLANQNKNLTIGQGNQNATNTAGQFNAGQTQAASTANQAASLASAQTQLQALGINEQQAEALFGADWANYLNSQTDPQALQQLVTQAYGLVPTGALQQSTSSGSGFGFGFGVKMPPPAAGGGGG